LQDLDRATLFVLLKTCKGLLTADAVLVCPVKLADVDAKVIGGTPFPSLFMKHLRAQREPPSVDHTICPVFNEEKARKPPAAWGRTPITQRSWRSLDGNVQIVTQLYLAHLGVGTT
jgi:hypothetical protein